MQNSAIDCDRIHAVRFFQITGLPLAFASAAILLVAFSPALKTRQEWRPKLYLIGAGLSGATLLWNLLSICLVASVEMPEPYGLCGAGFIFCILSSFMIVGALALCVRAMKSTWEPSVVVIQEARNVEKSQTVPTLLVNVAPTSQKQPTQLGKDAIDLERQISIVSADVMEGDATKKTTQASPTDPCVGVDNQTGVTCVAPGQRKIDDV
jgi:hypothetical protein